MTESMPTIYIVTPSYNAEETIGQTILSVVTQAGNFRIRYHVQDGGSSDETVKLLSEWKARLDRGSFPRFCKGVHFTYESLSDRGMYDALLKGFSKLSIPPRAFMTWINADDVLMPGALALAAAVDAGFSVDQISWLGGVASIIKNDRPIVQAARPIPTDVIRNGMCDGKHWTFIQQEGTFFRNWLWEAVNPSVALQEFKLAGDWNLWRLFAHHAEYVRSSWSLGAFRLREGQLSSSMSAYMAEIDATVPQQSRSESLRSLGDTGGASIRVLKARYPSGGLYVSEKSAEGQACFHYQKIFGRLPSRPLANKGDTSERVLFEGAVTNLIDTTTIAMPLGSSKQLHQRTKFFVVTPCLNMVGTIDKTIQSVISQDGDFIVRYHIQDGGSKDGTLDRLDFWADRIKKSGAFRNILFSWDSSLDDGMYDALRIGFDSLDIHPDGFMTWINGDDLLMPLAFSRVAQAAEAKPDIQWVGGTTRVIDDKECIIEQRDIPVPTKVIREGLCDGRYWYHLQQEGMFFRKSLWFKSKHALSGFRLAGDWSLWREFAKHADYVQLDQPLGSFRSRGGQLSVARFAEYEKEMAAELPIEDREVLFNELYTRRHSIQYDKMRFDKHVPVIEKKDASAYVEFFKARLSTKI